MRGELHLLTGFQAMADHLLTGTTVDIYDPRSDRWRSGTASPLSNSHVAAVVDGDDVWMAGGFVGNHPGVATDQVWRYHADEDRWQQEVSLPAPRASGGFVRVGRTLHYIAGLAADRESNPPDHWTLDLDDPVRWKEAPPLPRPRCHFQAVVVDEVIYAVGGQTGHDVTWVDQTSVDAFDTRTNSWSTRADLPAPRSHADAATLVIGDRILVIAGRNAIGRTHQPDEWQMDRITEYDTVADTWTQVAKTPALVLAVNASVIGTRVYLTSGGYFWNQPMKKTWFAEILDDCRC